MVTTAVIGDRVTVTGRGIAQIAALAGWPARLIDVPRTSWRTRTKQSLPT